MTTSKKLADDVYSLFFNPGEVTEIRALGCSGKHKAWSGFARDIVSGYFNQADSFAEAAAELEAAEPKGIYFTLNPVNPDLLARAANRLKAADAKTPTTADKDIVCLRWLYVDIDPKRPSGISATNEELEKALGLRNKISKWMKERGFAQAVAARSGNGAHLLVRIPDLENTQDNVDRIKRALEAINAKWGNQETDIDLKVYNPARICKLYGTWARKGDNTKDRPHRPSCIEPKMLELLKGERNAK